MNDLPELLNPDQFTAMLEQMGIADVVYNYHTLSGLILAVACAPDPVAPSEWFDLVFCTEEEDIPPFRNGDDAGVFFGQLLALWNHWMEQLADEENVSVQLEAGVELVDGKPTEPLKQFCKGILIGYSWLEEDWSELFDSFEVDGDEPELDAILGMTLTSALLLADPESARSAITNVDNIPADEQLSLETAMEFLPMGLGTLGGFVLALSEWEDEEPDFGPFADDDGFLDDQDPPALDEPCPCGSGKPFKKCCLN